MADQALPINDLMPQGQSSTPPVDTFENIFSKTKKPEKDSKMVKSILLQKEAIENLKPILGDAPDLGKTLEEEREYRLKRGYRLRQAIFGTIVLLALGMIGFFYTQLSPTFKLFGTNSIQRLHDLNSSLDKLQTQMNKSRYLAIQLALHELSYQADRFLGNFARYRDPTISTTEKAVFFANVEDAKKIIPVLLSDIRANLTSDFFAQTYAPEKEMSNKELREKAEFDLKNALVEERKSLGNSPSDPETIQHARLLDQTVKMVGNTSLLSTLQKISLEDFQERLDAYVRDYDMQKDIELRSLFDSILASSKSNLAVITDIKQNRIHWSQIIQQIELITTQADPVFGKPLISPDSNIVYSGYEFDSTTQKIILSGTTTTADGKNFTLMTDLMAKLDQSPMFSDTEMRSYSKTRDLGASGIPRYVANFKIDVRLESTPASK